MPDETPVPKRDRQAEKDYRDRAMIRGFRNPLVALSMIYEELQALRTEVASLKKGKSEK